MSGLEAAWGVLGAGLIVYVLTGGADFGGGIWDLLARGPRKEAQRRAIQDAIAPIWEANHVWLIFVIVILFTVFPKAFAAIGVALHIPLTLALVGICLRGSAFVFRAYGLQEERSQRRWGRAFAWASLLTPLCFGMALAALSTGRIEIVDGVVRSGFFAGWLTPFAMLVGLFGVVLFALLAAVYLTRQTRGAVQEDFRRRALGCEVIAGVLAFAVAWRAWIETPAFFVNLLRSPWSLMLQGLTGLAALGTMLTLWKRAFVWARVLVASQVALVVLGWGLAMEQHVIWPALPIEQAGTRRPVLSALFPALAVGALLLLPSLAYLYRVFEKRT